MISRFKQSLEDRRRRKAASNHPSPDQPRSIQDTTPVAVPPNQYSASPHISQGSPVILGDSVRTTETVLSNEDRPTSMPNAQPPTPLPKEPSDTAAASKESPTSTTNVNSLPGPPEVSNDTVEHPQRIESNSIAIEPEGVINGPTRKEDINSDQVDIRDEPLQPSFQAIVRRPTKQSLADTVSTERDITNDAVTPSEPSTYRQSGLRHEQAVSSDDDGIPTQAPQANRLSIGLASFQHERAMNIDPGLPRPPSPVSSADDEEDRWAEIVPLEVKCVLELSLDDEAPVRLVEELKIRWYNSKAWDYLDGKAFEWLETKGIIKNDKWQHVKLQHGSFRIIGNPHVSVPRKLYLPQHVPEVLVVPICGFISSYVREPFHLHVRWDYDSLRLRQKHEDYADTIRGELDRKKKENFRGQEFFSRHVLNHMLPEPAIDLVVEQDLYLRQFKPEDRLQLKKKLIGCNRLLLLCIWKRFSMKKLKKILDEDAAFDDKNWPSEQDCQALEPDPQFWKEFRRASPAFRPKWTYPFPPPPAPSKREDIEIVLAPEEEICVEPDKVVPIICDDEHAGKVGEGAFSNVLSVKIDPSYQEYTQDKNQAFALKWFKSDTKDFDKKYAHEKKVLENLRKLQKARQKRHIVTHFAAWSQGLDFFILFPLATGNLEVFMNYLPYPRVPGEPEIKVRFPRDEMLADPHTQLPTLNKKFVLWLFTQLFGLAEALDHIHHLVKSEEDREVAEEVAGLQVLEGREKLPPVIGYHHDIKPDNILIFVDSNIGFGTMKFGDFGSANIFRTDQEKLYTRSPNFTDKERGAITYSSPDQYCDGRITRRADVWTLGCVFLEIMLWCLEPREDQTATFSTKRYDEQSNPDDKIHSDKYWTRIGKSYKEQRQGTARDRVKLKQAVNDKFTWLQERCEADNMLEFEQLRVLTKQMMDPDSKKRIPSDLLATDLNKLLENVATTLSRKRNHYCGEIDDEEPENSVLYEITPPSPSTDPQNFAPQRTPPPETLDEAQRQMMQMQRAIYDLQQTQGQGVNMEPVGGGDILSRTTESDAALRGRVPDTVLGSATFLTRERSLSSRAVPLPFRRHMSDP